MPAIGSQPVRAATKTRNSEVSSGGIDSRTSDAARIAPAATPPRRLPVTTPSGRPMSVAQHQRGHREDGGVGGALGNQIAHRPVVLHRVAEVEPDGGGQPVAVLRADRLVEAVAGALLLDRLRLAPRAERLGDEVARRQPRQHQRRRRHGDHQEQREREPPREVADQWTTATVSGRQSSCGRYSAGVRLVTRDECAT